MFGYIECNRSKLSREEQERYQSVYCGLCRNLKMRYGDLERMSLSYDMTFVILFLSSLYEPRETKGEFRCGLHPLRPRSGVENCFTEYAADMTVVLAYFKALDDWKDEKKAEKRWYGGRLKKAYREVEKVYPRQCRAVADSIQELDFIEKAPGANVDQAINCSGKMLSELFVWKEDFWSNSLRMFGTELGKFIYLMDAAMDYKKDLKTGNYNPVAEMKKKPEEMEPILGMPLGNAMEIFEKLPLVQDENLLRNILYGGVWQQYYAKMHGKEKA
ncbi:hypothetical protein H8S44_00025 [Anaerosacchariphilus sp. NSJ-68]|uniref:Uncharacterized protein n=2 Tax=Lachnospiraceae TaxID=186803 RepID=A0A923L950_9FIRM|nr:MULTISPECIES: DUF5685 family protein [Lachnospiraceae]MBC5658173.1 hypothetical protein [Anaerosacchariphilus hominis]MBC5698621.1 hypothetical protein [Roseburia difficilis]